MSNTCNNCKFYIEGTGCEMDLWPAREEADLCCFWHEDKEEINGTT